MKSTSNQIVATLRGIIIAISVVMINVTPVKGEDKDKTQNPNVGEINVCCIEDIKMLADGRKVMVYRTLKSSGTWSAKTEINEILATDTLPYFKGQVFLGEVKTGGLFCPLFLDEDRSALILRVLELAPDKAAMSKKIRQTLLETLPPKI